MSNIISVGTRVTPKNHDLHLKHGWGCLTHYHLNKAVVHFENGTRQIFDSIGLEKAMTKTEAHRAALKDLQTES